MNSDNANIDTQSVQSEKIPNLTNVSFKSKLIKIISYLKPTVLNAITTIFVFVIALSISRMLGVSFLVGFGVYLSFAFIIQPLFKEKLGNGINIISLKRNNDSAKLISSNNNSVRLYIQKKYLIAITILRIDWLANFLNLNQICYFLQKEDIQIQDCREGCFLIIRKRAKLKSRINLQNEANKLVKSLERVVLLTKKKFEIEYENTNLHLVKGQEIIQTIMFLGLSPEKFLSYDEINSDAYNYLKYDSLYNQDQLLEEKNIE